MKGYLIVGLAGLLLLGFSGWMLSSTEEVRDPVCGMKLKAETAKFSSEYKGKKYYFCSTDCKTKFDQNPGKYVAEEKTAAMPEAICCALTGDILKEVRVEKKEADGGFIATMTSANPEVVKKLQTTLKQCQEGKMAGGQEMKGGQAMATTPKTCCEEKMEQKQHEQMGHKEHGEHAASGEKKEACCLMHDQSYAINLTNLPNGVRVEFKKK